MPDAVGPLGGPTRRTATPLDGFAERSAAWRCRLTSVDVGLPGASWGLGESRRGW